MKVIVSIMNIKTNTRTIRKTMEEKNNKNILLELKMNSKESRVLAKFLV